MGISRAQREWLQALGTLVGEAPADVAEDGVEEPSAEGRKGVRAGAEDKALFGGLIPGIPDVIPKITSRITIKNKTQLPLTIVQGSAKLENRTASFINAPPVDIDPGPGTEGSFSVTNDPPFPVPFPVGGTGGEVVYEAVVDDKKLRLKMQWERGGVAPSRKPIPDLSPKDKRFDLKGFNTGGEDFEFHFVTIGAPTPPGPGPNPQPAPAPNVSSSCLITVTNQTALELTRAEAEHERGDFMVPPPRTLAPNTTINFASVETPGAKEQGCKGFISWEVGSPAIAVWRIEWDNPEAAKNDSKATLVPKVPGLRTQDVIGQGDENVTVSFALSGEAPAPGPEVAFEPPVEAKQPTLRKGDKSPDGWVEYAQMLLNFHLGTKLKEDGDFGNATLAAVTKFQKDKKLQVDGTLGNQTWAALREGAPEKPSTDGRKPHTFVEKGAEARWMLESRLNNRFQSGSDLLRLAVQTVGDTPIDPATEATVRVTAPGAKPRVVKAKVGAPKEKSSTGFSHEVDLENFRKRFPSVPPDAPVTEYLVEAFLPKELGGDFYSGKVREA